MSLLPGQRVNPGGLGFSARHRPPMGSSGQYRFRSMPFPHRLGPAPARPCFSGGLKRILDMFSINDVAHPRLSAFIRVHLPSKNACFDHRETLAAALATNI